MITPPKGYDKVVLFQKVECNGGPIFRVVLGAMNLFLSISMAYKMCFHSEKLVKTLKF